jgi:hypothetical protein
MELLKDMQNILIIGYESNNYRLASELFIGDRRFSKIINTEAQYPEFKAHRHDQSVWSILCKLNKVNILTHDKNPMTQCHRRE